MKQVSWAILTSIFCGQLLFAQNTSKSIRTFTGHTDKVTSVIIAPDGKRFLSGSDDKTIHVWDIENTKPDKVLKEHQNYVLALAFSRDGKRFLSAGGGQWRGPQFATETDQFVRLWDAAELKVLKKMTGHQAPVWSVAFSLDEKSALSCSGGYDGSPKFIPTGYAIRHWNLETGESIREHKAHEHWVRDVAFLEGGKRFASGSWDKTVRLWDVDKNQPIQILRDHKDNIDGIAVASDGKWLVSGGGKPQGGGDTTIRLWNLADGKVVKRFTGHTKRVWKLAFTKDGTHFLSAGADNTIRLWDVASGKETHRFVGHTDEVRQAIFTPDEKYVISASHDKTLRLWKTP